MPQAQCESRATRGPLAPYLRDIGAAPLLSADAERRLAHRINQGDPEARERMVRANLLLVVSIARRYAHRGLPMEDLIAEGNMGLMRAAEGFDPSVGVRFSTYATYWIKQSIRRALVNTARAVRVPAYMAELLTKWRRAEAALHEELGRPPEEEVAGRLGLAVKKLKMVRKAMRVYGGAAQEDAGGEGLSLAELLAGGSPPDAQLEGAEEVSRILGQLNQLGPREAGVLRLRFGLGGDGPMTRQEVGEGLGLTRERVRQIESDALSALRQSLGA